MKTATLELEQPRTITIAELCEAIANGALQAQVEDDMYIIRSRDLAKLGRPQTIIPPITLSTRRKMVQAS